MAHSSKNPHPFKSFTERLMIGKERKAILEKHNWYRNIKGGYTHPHGMDWMSLHEILSLSPAALEYKLQHGSMSTLPANLT